MSIEKILIQIILCIFPLVLYLLYLTYRKNKKNDIVLFYASLIFSIILIIIYNKYFDNPISILFVNIPLLISYLKKDKYLPIILSIIIVCFYHNNYGFNIYLIGLEYVLYYYLYIIIFYKKLGTQFIINSFTFIKGIILSFEMCLLLPNTKLILIIAIIFLLLIVFYFLSYTIICFLKKGEDIIDFNIIIQELEKEKALKKALFQITHEVKNPLAVCKGYLKMMDYNNIDKIKKYNKILTNELELALTIMDDFLDYTKIKVNLDIIDINYLLEDINDSFAEMFKKNNVKNEIEIGDDEIFINGDYNRLKQAFLNIIKNAIEASNSNGIIKIRVKEQENKVLISIKDNGCGMNSETLKKMGEPFFTTKERGTGLGVGMVKEIVNLHKGTILYQSKENIGTKVIITFPKLKEV